MATTSSPISYTEGRVLEGSADVPWYLWAMVLAVTSVTIGGQWDVSWHRSIGRDTFWTSAHMAIYLCGLLAGVACGYLILATTFLRAPGMVASSVEVFGLRGPLGAFLGAWGGIAMLTSAPFDNWWHDAYGLDVKIVSPPHVLLMIGIAAISYGALILVLGAMNRAEGRTRRLLQGMVLFLGGLMCESNMFARMEYTWSIHLHSASAYRAVALGLPLLFALLSRASGSRFAATWSAAIYMLFIISLILILPLFPAEPKLGPVYHAVTHFVPPGFPILLIVPALALDLVWARTRAWTLWQIALVSGPLFVGTLVAAEWPFASFLMSPRSANRFFGTGYFDYATPAWSEVMRRVFVNPEHGAVLVQGLMVAAICGSVMTWIGLGWGRWLERVQR